MGSQLSADSDEEEEDAIRGDRSSWRPQPRTCASCGCSSGESAWGSYGLENDLFPEMSLPIGEQCLECRDRQPASKGKGGNGKGNSWKGHGKGKGKHSGLAAPDVDEGCLILVEVWVQLQDHWRARWRGERRGDWYAWDTFWVSGSRFHTIDDVVTSGTTLGMIRRQQVVLEWYQYDDHVERWLPMDFL